MIIGDVAWAVVGFACGLSPTQIDAWLFAIGLDCTATEFGWTAAV